jgi:hypothetical protein
MNDDLYSAPPAISQDARNDFPFDRMTSRANWLLMCAEIDRLRAAPNPVLDRLREMFGIEATDVEGVFEALEKYDAAMHRSAFGRRPDGDARCSECAGRLWVACSECGRPS